MFDIGMSEIVVVAVVALIAIGPKDLPRTLRMMGRTVGKVRDMAGEFRRHFDDMVREAELDEVRRKVDEIRRGDLDTMVEKAVDGDGVIKRGLELPDEDADKPTESAPVPVPEAPVAAEPPETPAGVHAEDKS